MDIGEYLLDIINEAENSEFILLILGKDCTKAAETAGQFFPSCVIYSAEVTDEDIKVLKEMNILFDYVVMTDVIDDDEKFRDIQRVLPLLDKKGHINIACPNSNNILNISDLLKCRTKRSKNYIVEKRNYTYADIGDRITDLNLLITKFGLFGDPYESVLNKDELIKELGDDHADSINALYLPYIRFSLKKEEAYIERSDIFPDSDDGLKSYVGEVNSFNTYNIVIRKSYQDYEFYMKNLDPLKKEVKFNKEANDILKNKILEGSPFCALRVGNTEATLIDNYFSSKLEGQRGYSNIAVNYALKTGGFFVPESIDLEKLNDYFDDLVNIQLEGFRNADIMMMWGACRMEAVLANHFALPSCCNISYFSLIPYIEEYEPWTIALASKKVLVVTSVPDSVEYQYRRKDVISPYKISVLPEFTLITYRMIQTCQQDKKNFGTWFDALAHVEKDILSIDFDIAIVGAGFYGVPLCNAIKKAGKIAIEMCGLTPFIFGIAGKRFVQDQKGFYGKYMTDAWIRPFDEKPSWYAQVEGGCYW